MKINSPGIFIIFFILFLSSGASAQIINTVAGTPQVTGYMGDMGAAIFAEFDNPSDLVVDSLGNLYIADFLNNVIRIVDVAGNINTFAGNGAGAGTMAAGGYTGDGGAATAAELNGPYGLAIDSRGNIYFADGYNHAVRKVNTSGIITTFAGKDTAGYRGDGGPATAALLDNPVAIAIDHSGNVYIADDHNHVVRKVDTSGIITTFAGNDTLGYRGDGGPATAAELNLPIGLAIDALSNLYISDEDNNNIRKVTTTGVISTFVATDTAHGYSGDGGPAASATLYGPAHIAVGNSTLYISDVLNNVIRTVDIESGLINTFVGAFYGEDDTVKFCEYGGDGGPATAAQICDPNGVAIGDSGKIYICDRGNQVIRELTPIYYAAVPVVAQGGAKLTAYPNPAFGGVFTVRLSSGAIEPVLFTFTNMLGEKIREITAATNAPVALALDAPGGVYFLSATTEQGSWNMQVVVQQ